MANKLELVWVDKEKPVVVEPRILVEKPELSYRKETPVSLLQEAAPTFDNLLIHGDNLLALKALEAKFSGKIKCIYIDPPYNTGNAFSTYDDNLEHSIWLNLMKPRLEIIRSLLTDDGSLWISIDDDEQAYLKVLCDEVFGRGNFVCNVIWEKKYSQQNDAKWLYDSHDFIIVYAKKKELFRPNLLPRSEQQNKYYKYDDHDGRGPWRSDNVLVKTFSQSGVFGIENPNTHEVFYPPEGSCYRFSRETAMRMLAENRFYFGKDGKGRPQLKRYLAEVKQGTVSNTLWFRDEVGDNQEAKNENKLFHLSFVFSTPKPERLIQKILTLATNPGDWVLDSFLGSGTTAAVAQKMGRRWIGVEMTNVAETYDKPRLDLVISGADHGGITKTTGYSGGGGYRYYEIAPTLINEDDFGQAVINPDYNVNMLAAAVALHEGYSYEPNADCYWKQGNNGSGGYLFVTTKHVSADFITSLSNSLNEGEFLVVVCKSFDDNARFVAKNVTIKKIPQSLLKNCEFGRDSYDLNIVCPPAYEYEEEEE